MENQIVTGIGAKRCAFGAGRTALRPRLHRAFGPAFVDVRLHAEASATPTPAPALDMTSTGTS